MDTSIVKTKVATLVPVISSLRTQYNDSSIDLDVDTAVAITHVAGTTPSANVFKGDVNFVVGVFFSIDNTEDEHGIQQAWQRYSSYIKSIRFIPVCNTMDAGCVYINLDTNKVGYVSVDRRVDLDLTLQDFINSLKKPGSHSNDDLTQLEAYLDTFTAEDLTPDNIRYNSVGIFNKVRQFFGMKLSEYELLDPITRKQMNAALDIDHVKAAQSMIYVPPGFKGDFLAYLKSLQANQIFVDRLLTGVLLPLKSAMAQASAASALSSNTVDKDLLALGKLNVDVAKKNISKHFDISQREKLPYSRCFPSAKDWVDVNNTYNNMVESTQQITRVEILKVVDDINSYVDGIIHNIENREMRVSKPQMVALTTALHAAAVNVDYYASHVSSLLIMGNVLRKTIDDSPKS